MMNKINKTAVLLVLCFAPVFVKAQSDALKIPAELRNFIEIDATPIALEKADLNGDGRTDFLIVTERKKVRGKELPDDERLLLILVREADGKLKIAARSEQIVYCRSCGGVMGDPFAGVEVRRNGFTVSNYGGSNLRWSESYQFNYSSRDKTWQLVSATEETFNALEPRKVKTRIYTPKNFGKINIADFDPAKIGKSQ